MVLDFCGHPGRSCRAYIPEMRGIITSLKRRESYLVAVSVDDDKAKWLTLWNETKMDSGCRGLTEGGFKAGKGVWQNLISPPYQRVVIVEKDGKIAQSLELL